MAVGAHVMSAAHHDSAASTGKQPDAADST